MSAIIRPLDHLKRIQDEIATSSLAPERLRRLQAALTDYGRDTYFDVTFGEEESIRATVRSLARYLAGLDPTFTPTETQHCQDYFEIIHAVVNPASTWDETDRRITALYADPAFGRASLHFAKDEQGEYWKRKFLDDALERLVDREPEVDVLGVVLRVSTPFGIDQAYIRARLFEQLSYGFVEKDVATSLGRHAVELFRAQPLEVLAESVAAKRSYCLIHAIFLVDRGLFTRHYTPLREALLAHGANMGFIRRLAEVDAVGYADLVKDLVTTSAPDAAGRQDDLARLLKQHYPHEQELFRQCALRSLRHSAWDLPGEFPARCLWVAEHFPAVVLDPKGPLGEIYPGHALACIALFLPVFKERALPFALHWLLTKPPHYRAREYRRHVVNLFGLLKDYDLSPHRDAITRFFARRTMNKQVRIEAMALLNGEPLVITETFTGQTVGVSYAFDQYGALLRQSWLAECLAARAEIPQPMAEIVAGRRDEELEVCALTVIDDARGSVEIAVTCDIPPGFPHHVDEVDDDESSGTNHSDRYIKQLLKCFEIPASTDLIGELGWNGALARLRTYEMWRALHLLVGDLREQGIACIREPRLRSSDDDGERAVSLVDAENAVREDLDFLSGRPLLTEAFARLTYVDRERQAWLIGLVGGSQPAKLPVASASSAVPTTSTAGIPAQVDGATATMTAPQAQATWDEIQAAVRKTRGAVEIDWPPTLPWRMRAGFPLTLDGALVLRALRQALRDGVQGVDSPIIRLLRAVVDPTSLDALGSELASCWVALAKKPADRRWLVEAAAALGAARTVEVLGAFLWEKRLESTANAAFLTALGLLSTMDGLIAAHEVYGVMVMPSRYDNRRFETGNALTRMANRRGVNTEALIACCVPPAPTGALAERVMQAQSRRLERAMVNGHRWQVSTFTQDFLTQPVPAYLLSGVVLASFTSDGRLMASFVARDGRFLDLDGREVSPDPELTIGIAHPIELDDAGVLRHWCQMANRWSFYQSFAQLGRSIHRLTAAQAATNVIQDFHRYDRDWLTEQEWSGGKDDSDYMSDVDHFEVRLPRDGNKRVQAKLDGSGRVWGLIMGKAPLEYHEQKHFIRPSDPAPFGSLHPVSQSEVLYALLGKPWVPHVTPPPMPWLSPPPASPGATSVPATSVAPSFTPAALPGTRTFPYAEQAPTGRATCLVCRQRIALGSVRVAIERQIDTAEFKGAGAGYLHAACAAEFPALASLPDRDAVIRRHSQIPWP